MSVDRTLTVDSLSKKFDTLCLEFYDEKNKAKFEDYIGFEKLSEEFIRLGLPKASDVLNAAAGPGILSAWLQARGYGNIDAHDCCMDNVKTLMSTGLYRNYICRPLNKLNSSGLKEDIYDAVVMLGGFCPGNINATAINELMRITKPDGHILWTLREDHHSKDSDFGLLDETLTTLEKAGKCQIMKFGEKFQDPHSELQGMLYVIKRIDVEDFHPEVPGKLPSIVVNAVKDKKATQDNQQQFYDEWGENRSEEDLVLVGQYTGHLKLCQAFFKLRLQRNVEILDVSSHLANPGLVGMELSHNGYDCVDGLDHNIEALNSVKRQGKRIYRNYILGRVAELGSIPTNDETYDVILMAGGFAPGKLLPSAFSELLRVLRPGGYILWTMRDGFGASDPEFALFDVKVQDLVLERKWELLVGPVFFDNFALHHPGRFYMLRKCHREVYALGSPRHSPNSSPRLSRRRHSLKNY